MKRGLLFSNFQFSILSFHFSIPSMKPLLPILGLLLSITGLAVTAPKKKNIGPCMPYAEKCLNCVDCTQCKHCAVIGGKCSVCFKK